MQATEILQSIFRWFHVVAGVIWLGHLYFFNFVNGPFAATMDAETKKKVVPELMPRALFWFRWGAVFTWSTGILLLMLVFYHGRALFEDYTTGWNAGALVMIAVTFLGVYVYDALMKGPLGKNLKAAAAVFFVLIAAVAFLMQSWAGFGYRGYNIHIGSLFGTIMAFNVWFRIWPAQQKIIAAIKTGQPPDPALVSMAGTRSKQNTYMSIPLIWTMLSIHNTWAASHWLYLPGVVAFAWFGTMHLYKRAGKVKGF